MTQPVRGSLSAIQSFTVENIPIRNETIGWNRDARSAELG